MCKKMCDDHVSHRIGSAADTDLTFNFFIYISNKVGGKTDLEQYLSNNNPKTRELEKEISNSKNRC